MPQQQFAGSRKLPLAPATIMLTIAMLAESNIPLVIDQPKDDLKHARLATRNPNWSATADFGAIP
jgi:hypothetical protein